MIVKAFENLNDVSSRSYSKRVLILETVAKVRSCVVMLDLECDTLILEMFRHFLRTIRYTISARLFFLPAKFVNKCHLVYNGIHLFICHYWTSIFI